MNSPLFITARFRTGSTMLWNLFRQLPEVQAYYEPLHDSLINFIKHPIPPEKSHLNIKSSYFDEYKDANMAISLHQSDFTNHRLYLESDESYPELQAYIQSLVESAPPGHSAVLQFNRIDFRLAWIKKKFPKANLLHLTRNPRDQWYSTLANFSGDIDHYIDYEYAYDIITWARDLYKQFPFLATPQIEHAYQRFYYIWKLSYLAGKRLSDLSVAYENILAEPQKQVAQILNFANLYSENNLETCLKVIESKPEHAWNKERSDAWFSDMEKKCEAVLDELGLNKNFAFMQLAEIQEGSTKYQAMLRDLENDRWATLNFKRAIIRERNTEFELRCNLNQGNIKVLNKLDEVRVEREQIQTRLDQALVELESVYHSHSYRITAPLRALLGVARKLVGRISNWLSFILTP
jgi:hypothetical protein